MRSFILVALFSYISLAVTSGIPNSYVKRDLCPKNLFACQVYGRPSEFWDCVDIKKDEHNCGGCNIRSEHPEYCQDVGDDCSSIPYATDVSCDGGKCHVHHCAHGFKPGPGGSSCVDDYKPPKDDDDKDKDGKDNDGKDKDGKDKDGKDKDGKDGHY